MSTITGILRVWWNVINGFLCRLGGMGFKLGAKGHPLLAWQEVLTRQSHCPTKFTLPKLVSSDIISACMLLCVTAVCSLHAREVATQ